MNFEALIRLERCARIDLGVRIDLPWEDLRRWSLGITVDDPHGPKDDPAACIGPHVAVGKIKYTDEDFGVLIYIKSCITGDENDLVRDYRRRNPDFPHETTPRSVLHRGAVRGVSGAGVPRDEQLLPRP